MTSVNVVSCGFVSRLRRQVRVEQLNDVFSTTFQFCPRMFLTARLFPYRDHNFIIYRKRLSLYTNRLEFKCPKAFVSMQASQTGPQLPLRRDNAHDDQRVLDNR